MTRWYLRRDCDLVELVVEEIAEPRRGVVTWLMPEDLTWRRRHAVRHVIPQLRAELARRIAAVDAPLKTYDPKEAA